MAEKSFDVIVIGAGPGGYVCAIRAAQLGLSVACVEMRETLGGTCLNVGCIPSKALLQSSEKFAEVGHALADHGVKVEGVSLDLARMQARKGEVVKANVDGVAFLFRKNKVTWLKGRGRIVAPGKVEVAGETYAAKHIVIATGSESVPLPGVEVDEQAIVTSTGGLELDRVPGHLVVIGGGYIGLEAAAVARKLGLAVTLVEAAPRILGRVAAPETAEMIRALHRAHGVEIVEGTGIARITGWDAADGVELTDGRRLPADLVICGIGIAPETALAEAAGLAIDNGIATDALGRTSDPAIWAAGDCASFPAPDGRLRLESVGNAIDMAEAVAANMLGADAPYVPKPWFWSDQFDAKLQIAGLNLGYDRVVTRPAANGGSVWYFRGGRLIAVDALNDARAYMIGKRLIEAGRSPEPEAVAEAAELKALMA